MIRVFLKRADGSERVWFPTGLKELLVILLEIAEGQHGDPHHVYIEWP